ncbi:MAG: hypothetical protein KGM17_04515 [Sphingomonadales bacterium]|nr:hypothetical protein [Sphingomonadales bacterium]
MSDRAYWDVDKVAAIRLLGSFGIEVTPASIGRAAEQFAEHREWAANWSLERAHDAMIRKLENGAMDRFASKSDDWASGYSFAEMQVASMSPAELAGREQAGTLSKGRILRSMLRQARRAG